MNKNKISSNIFESKILSCNSKNIFILSSNYHSTKKILDDNKKKYKSYHFCNCFNLKANENEIYSLSDEDSILSISENCLVQKLNKEADFINIKNLTANSFLGQNQTICFIDTGIYPHLDFLMPQKRLIRFIDLVNNKDFPYDDNGHGTFVAGVACGNGLHSKKYTGFAPLSNIIAIKALNKDGNSDSNLILDAMEWIFENQYVYNIKIVCMSFGADIFDVSDPLSKGAEALWLRGITVVAAAGNSGPEQKTIKSPGCNSKIITVGAYDLSSKNIADFSSRGPTPFGHKPDLVAPATNLISCNNGYAPYTVMSGTSVSTPIIAGICADILSKYPHYTNNEIKKYLINHCTKITGNQDIEGAGLLKF